VPTGSEAGEDGEQTWPTEAELEDVQKLIQQQQRKKKFPKGEQTCASMRALKLGVAAHRAAAFQCSHVRRLVNPVTPPSPLFLS
jgi:hypothetical protein